MQSLCVVAVCVVHMLMLLSCWTQLDDTVVSKHVAM
jgi:hypothetical protein